MLLNTANPIMIIVYTLIVAGIIFLSRKSESVIFIIFLIVAIIGLLIYHSIVLDILDSTQEVLISQTYHCIAVDLVLLLLTFISYLWVDDLVARKKKLKSYDDSLSWFWNKI